MQTKPRIILGLISLIFGTTIILWVLYNLFVETQEHYSGPRSPLALLFGGFGLGGLLFKYGWHSFLILTGLRKDRDFEL